MATGINLDKAMSDILAKFSTDVSKAASEAIGEVAKESAKKLQQTGPRRSGQYAAGWTYKIEKGTVTNSATVYGKKKTYPIAHLLEHGHAKRGGGHTAPIVHIKPVEEWAISEVEKRIIEKVEGNA